MDADTQFMRLGVQYYTLARCAVHAGLVPVCGNLYHHAIEMLLKGHLSQSHTLQALSRRPFGHALGALWAEFKTEFPVAGLEQFDGTIATLDRFEEIRYPDVLIRQGAGMIINWDTGSSPGIGGPAVRPDLPSYEIVVTEIDRLVAKIFELCSRNPQFFTGMNPYGRDALSLRNPMSADWF